MAAFDRFRCNITSSGADLCFNGGQCVTVAISPLGEVLEEACVCPRGWGPDNMVFKNPNCALPDYALLALFVANSLASVVYLWMLYKVHSRAKDRALRILRLAVAAVILFDMEILAIYLENGWFTATSIIVCFVIATFCAWASELSQILSFSAFAINVALQRKVKQFIQFSFAFFATFNAASCIALAVLARQSSINFNRAMSFYMLGQFVSVVLIATILIRYGRQLKREVANHRSEVKDLVDKKIKAVFNGALSFVGGQMPALMGVFLLWGIGSTPYYWTVAFPGLLMTPVALVHSTLGLFKILPSSSETLKRPASKEHINKSGIVAVEGAMIESQADAAVTPGSGTS